MKLLKFRAFLKSENRFIDLNGLNISFGAFPDKGSVYAVTEQGVVNEHPIEDIDLMSFAGFRDKMGKDVYEGDIVTAWSAGSKANFQIKWRQEGSPCFILFPAWQNKEMWRIAATEHGEGKMFLNVDGSVSEPKEAGWYDDGLEIIGNIYENPELILHKS